MTQLEQKKILTVLKQVLTKKYTNNRFIVYPVQIYNFVKQELKLSPFHYEEEYEINDFIFDYLNLIGRPASFEISIKDLEFAKKLQLEKI
jgi:hypothetical protein